MPRMTGDYGALQVQVGTTTTYSDLAKFRQLNLDESRDYYDATVMADANIVEAEGKPRFQLQGEFVADTADLDTVLVALRAGGTKNYKFWPDKTNKSLTVYSGPMFITGGLNVSVQQVLTGNVNVRAAGSVVLTTT
jgi:hypothetical protein